MHSRSLQWLNLSGCSRLAEFSVSSEKLEYLSLDGTALEELPSLAGCAKNLSFLSLAGCKLLENLPNNFYKIGLDTCVKISSCPELKRLPPIFDYLSSITSLCLDGCSNLSILPDNLDHLSTLNELSVRGTSIYQLPASIKLLSKLRTLNVSHCKRLLSLPMLPLLLQDLNASGCISLGIVSSSYLTAFQKIFCSTGKLNDILLRRQIEENKISLRHRYYSQRFEFYSCIGLNYTTWKRILAEAVNRMMHAAYISSMLQASAEPDPYHQFHQFPKDTDARSFEYTCRQLCTSFERHKFPSWFWVQKVESSTVTVKLNGNCCSYCRGHPYAFGIYLSNKGEITDLGFDGTQRICMQQWDQLPMWSYWKLGCNDVRLSLPASSVPRQFKNRSTNTTRVTVNLSPDSHPLAFVLCVVVTNCLSNLKWSLSNVKCKCYLENEGKRSESYRSAYSCDSEMDLISDTLFAWYDAYTSNKILEATEESRANDQCTTSNSKLSFEFSLTQESLNYQINECAVWPIYASDIECESRARRALIAVRQMASVAYLELVTSLTMPTDPLHQTKKLKK